MKLRILPIITSLCAGAVLAQTYPHLFVTRRASASAPPVLYDYDSVPHPMDTAGVRSTVHDTADVLRSYTRSRISDSLTANSRGWTTLPAARSAISDSMRVERAFDTTTSRLVARDTATVLRARLADTASALRAALDSKQPLDADLTSIAALSTQSFGRSLLTQADAPAARATLGAQAALGYTPVNRAGDTMTGNLVFNVDGLGVTTCDGGRFYKKSGSGIVTRLSHGNQRMQVENNAGTILGTYWDSGNLTNLNQLTNGPGYLTGNQTITLSGVVTGSGATAITTSIADAALSIAKTSGLQTALNEKQAANVVAEKLITARPEEYQAGVSIFGTTTGAWPAGSAGVVTTFLINTNRATQWDVGKSNGKIYFRSADAALGSGWTDWSLVPVPTAFAQTLLDDADAAAARATLGAAKDNRIIVRDAAAISATTTATVLNSIALASFCGSGRSVKLSYRFNANDPLTQPIITLKYAGVTIFTIVITGGASSIVLDMAYFPGPIGNIDFWGVVVNDGTPTYIHTSAANVPANGAGTLELSCKTTSGATVVSAAGSILEF